MMVAPAGWGGRGRDVDTKVTKKYDRRGGDGGEGDREGGDGVSSECLLCEMLCLHLL